MKIRHLTKTVHHTVYPAISPSNPLNSARGKTVIISGGASGIGYGIAQSFAAAGAATVIIIARRQAPLDEASSKLRAEIAAAGNETGVWTYLLDITREADVNGVFDDIRKRLNGIGSNDPNTQTKEPDVLVTSAAYITQGETTLDYSAEAYREVFETNFYGNLNLTRAFLKPEIPAIPLFSMDGSVKKTTPSPYKQKVILDISSYAAYLVLPGQAAYATSKCAYTRALQQLQTEVDELPGKPIRIHSFHPGAIFTEASRKALKKKPEGFDWDDESLPGGLSVWLASPAAAFLKGRYLLCNWDVEELMALKGKFEEDPEFGRISLHF